jgi:predicted nucleic acid-binding protein
VSPEPVVLDASVGVKWFRAEAGSDEAVEVVRRHVRGEVGMVVPVVFVHEVLEVARRLLGVDVARQQWTDWRAMRIHIAGIDDALVASALDLSVALDCTLYDAMAPALAERLGAPLYSADRHAHGRVDDVVLIG